VVIFFISASAASNAGKYRVNIFCSSAAPQPCPAPAPGTLPHPPSIR